MSTSRLLLMWRHTLKALIVTQLATTTIIDVSFPNRRVVAKPVVPVTSISNDVTRPTCPDSGVVFHETPFHHKFTGHSGLDTNERDVAKAVVPVTSISNDVTRPTCPDSGVVFHTTPFHHKFTGHSGLDTLLALQVCVQADSIDCYPAYD